MNEQSTESCIVIVYDSAITSNEAIAAIELAIPNRKYSSVLMSKEIHRRGSHAVWFGDATQAQQIIKQLDANGLKAAMIRNDASAECHKQLHQLALMINRQRPDAIKQMIFGIFVAFLLFALVLFAIGSVLGDD